MELQLFNFGSEQVRVILNENNEPEFCASDVTTILGYNNGRDAIAKHCSPKGVAKHDTLTKGGTQSLTYITEGNLYRLVAKSNKPEAEKFEEWVFDEVLPTIRKHGIYATDKIVEQAISDPDSIIKVLTQLKTERQQRQLAESKAMLLEEVTLQQAPKVQYFDQCLQSQQLISTTELANELGFSSALALNKFLKEQKILRRVNNNWALSADYSGVGLAAYKTHPYKTSTGADATNHLLCWTEKGRLFLRQFSNVKSTESI